MLGSFGRDLPPAHPRRPRLRELPDRRRGRRRRRRRRPPARHRRVPAARPLPGRPHRARARDPQPRRPRLRPRPARRPPPARRIHIHRDAAPDYDHEPFDDGWELELGSLRVRALHTPGHRPEHTRVRADRHARAARSRGRCSPATACSSATSRGPTWRSTRRRARAGSSARCTSKLLALPDTAEVWPGHLGGSLCGGPGMDLKVSSTIGFERAAPGAAAASQDEDEFVRETTAAPRPAAAELPQHRRAQPRPAGDGDAPRRIR